MKTHYILSEDKDGRVILDTEAHGPVIRTIEADSWIEARCAIHEFEFESKEGYGYVNT